MDPYRNCWVHCLFELGYLCRISCLSGRAKADEQKIGLTRIRRPTYGTFRSSTSAPALLKCGVSGHSKGRLPMAADLGATKGSYFSLFLPLLSYRLQLIFLRQQPPTAHSHKFSSPEHCLQWRLIRAGTTITLLPSLNKEPTSSDVTVESLAGSASTFT